MATANEVCTWLKKVSVLPLDYAVPVRVTLGKHEFIGARYGVKETYTATERAVTEGIVTAGEPYVDHRFYLLGQMPKFKKSHVCFVWAHDLPIDERVYQRGDEWYRSCYSDNTPGELGHFFMLGEWKVHAYGYYKGHKIDTLERYTYERVPMTVELIG
jgi:hypothetical protein